MKLDLAASFGLIVLGDSHTIDYFSKSARVDTVWHLWEMVIY